MFTSMPCGARYEAGRAERAFHECEPENRLVARNLESRWEARLAVLAEAEKSLICRDRVAKSVHIPRPDSTEPPADHERTVAEVAAVLDISTNVVYYWIERHHVRARRGPGGRWFIDFGVDA